MPLNFSAFCPCFVSSTVEFRSIVERKKHLFQPYIIFFFFGRGRFAKGKESTGLFGEQKLKLHKGCGVPFF